MSPSANPNAAFVERPALPTEVTEDPAPQQQQEKQFIESEDTSSSSLAFGTADRPLEPVESKQHDTSEESLQAGAAHPTDLQKAPSAAHVKEDRRLSLTRETLFVFVICSSNIVTQAGLGMTIVPLNIISRSFGSLNPGQLSWFVAAYSLTVGTFILIAGRLGDLYGHKLLFIMGFLWYGLWSLVTGLTVYTHSQIFFDVCRALQGVGPAMMVPNSLALLGRTYPPGRRKEMIFSLYGATAPNGFIIGAAFGSLLAQFAWWPWEFWIMAIACCLLGLMAILVVPSTGANDQSPSKGTFDTWGAISGVSGLVLFNVAWNQAPIVGWDQAYIIVLLILGIAFMGLFFFVESRVDHPLVPINAMSGKAGFVLGCIALGWSSFGIWVYYFFQFLENLRHVTPLLGAAMIVPTGVSGFCAALTTGYVLSRIPTSVVMVIALLAFCVGNVLLATSPVGQTYWAQTFLTAIITPWGMDMSFPAATIILSDLVPKEHQGVAASLVVTIVNYSISIGLGIAGTVEVHVNDGGQNLLKGYRGASYAAVGLSGLGVFWALYFAVDQLRRKNKHPPQ